MKSDDQFRLGVDVGGTFTDIVLLDESNSSIHHTKSPSTPTDPEQGALNGIEKILEETNTDPHNVSSVIHGTTVATNAVIERTGANTGLLVTQGFRDTLEIRRQNRPHMFDFSEQKEPPVINREKIQEVDERVLPNGETRDPLDEESARQAIRKLLEFDVEAIAVCLLHSYANSDHEERVRELIEEESQDQSSSVKVSISSDILPEFKEYERTSTTSMNGYLLPVMDRYLERFQRGLSELGIDARLNIMQSNGGMMTANGAKSETVQTLVSGPAAGALAGKTLSPNPSFLTADMGGTSFDVALSNEGDLEFTNEIEISGHILRVPMVDITTIGAGGGSIAWIDSGGVLRVGPQSAGATPGPVAYGNGGTEPTVTDAHVVLGRINPEYLLNGEMSVNLEGARQVIREKLAQPLDLSIEEAAQGVLDVVNAHMVKSMRLITVERGYDPREFSMISFGGAGPLHGIELAEELDMAETIIPRMPGVNSAVGTLTADYRNDYRNTYFKPLSAVSSEDLTSEYNSLSEQALSEMAEEGISKNQVSVTRQMQVRYQGQGYNLEITIGENDIANRPEEAITERFSARHQQEYGFVRDDEDIEIVNIGLSAVGKTKSPDLKLTAEQNTKSLSPADHRDVYINGEWQRVPIYDRDDLSIESQFRGPAIVEQFSSTTVIPPAHTVTVDEYQNLTARAISKDE